MKDKLMPWRKRPIRHEPEWEEHPLDVLFREVNDLFDIYFRGTGRFGQSLIGSAGYEVSETDDEIRVKVELPGMDEKDVQVDLEEDMLIVRADREQQKETKKRHVHVSEMSCGAYRRSIPLPAKVDGDKAQAKFKRGVLTLTLPKIHQTRANLRRIEVMED
ncbi:Hsp20/alpha crystallin family protein [Pontiellaceae bacterium B12219]|nr:Hsp20/alpha crystallin family protein [Pontiellaceae bacterium B12219]